jgi:cytochrome P450
MGLMNAWQENVKADIAEIIKDHKARERYGYKTIFHELLERDLAKSEKLLSSLSSEERIVVAAGTNTTAHTLTNITFHLLQEYRVMNIIKRELDNYFPDGSCDFTWT